MICAYCKITIDDDSFHCDQCGKEVLVCPKCNQIGKGKMCTGDGTPLIPARTKIATTPDSGEVAGEVPIAIIQPVLPSPVVSDTSELHLINKTLGLDIKVVKNCLIGRTKGDFVDIFSKYPQVSGQHLQINFNPQTGWTAMDLGSTNGTKYNNNDLRPMQLQVLTDKSYLRIANIEFYVQILTEKKTGKAGTVRL
jgi:predicted RNA-binding Zn-ribbon protein involved in translation (DUF1610 family)